MRFILVLLTVCFFSGLTFPATINIPSNYSTIQEGIDASSNGDTVLIAPGIYEEWMINFKGKSITVTSSHGPEATIVNGKSKGSVFVFNHNETPSARLERLTIKRGSGSMVAGWYDGGGGVLCVKSSPTISENIIIKNSVHNQFAHGAGVYCVESKAVIKNNVFYENKASHGGAIACSDNSDTLIQNNIIYNNTAIWGAGIRMTQFARGIIEGNVIFNNTADSKGGGMYCSACSSPLIIRNNGFHSNTAFGKGGGLNLTGTSDLELINNVISHNHASYGGGIYCYQSSPRVVNNTIVNNSADDGGGIGCYLKSAVVIRNSILWSNQANVGKEISLCSNTDTSILHIKYSNIDGGLAAVHAEPHCLVGLGKGVINKDPQFVSGPKGDFYLSQIAAGQPVNSPCVDGGDDLAINLGLDMLWTRTDEKGDSGLVDMGYHYGASVLPSLNGDVFSFSEGVGGSAKLKLLGGLANANKSYMIFGSLTGTSPGVPLPGNMATLPIKWDLFTNIVITFANQPQFQNFMGTLDGSGNSEALLNLPPLPGFAETRMYFAYGLAGSSGVWDFSSNPLMIDIVP